MKETTKILALVALTVLAYWFFTKPKNTDVIGGEEENTGGGGDDDTETEVGHNSLSTTLTITSVSTAIQNDIDHLYTPAVSSERNIKWNVIYTIKIDGNPYNPNNYTSSLTIFAANQDLARSRALAEIRNNTLSTNVVVINSITRVP